MLKRVKEEYYIEVVSNRGYVFLINKNFLLNYVKYSKIDE